MSRRASFFVEIRFTAERRWRAHSRRTDLLSAVKTAETLAHTRAEEWPYQVFPNVRVRYRGITLALWKDGRFFR